MHTKNVLFADLGKWNFEKQNNLLVYYAGCKKTVKEFLIDNDFSNKKIKKKLSQSNNFFSAIIESKDKITTKNPNTDADLFSRNKPKSQSICLKPFRR